MSTEKRIVNTTYSRIVGPVGLLLAACLVSITALVYVATEGQDENAIAASVHLAETALEGDARRLGALTLEMAYWDEAVDNLVTSFDPVWADDEIGVYVGDAYGIDGTYALDASNTPIYSSVDGERGAEDPKTRFQGGLAELIDAARAGSKSAAPIPQTGLVSDGGTVFAVAVTALTTYQGATDIGTDALLLMVDALDADRLATLGENYLLPSLTFADAAEGATASLAVRAPNGSVLGYLVWEPDLPGQRILPTLLIGIAAAGCVIGGAWIIFLRRTRAFAEDLAAEAENHAQKSELLRSTLDSVDHGIAAWDADDNLLVWNAKCESIWYNPENVAPGMSKQTLLQHIASQGVFGGENPYEQAQARYAAIKADGTESGDAFQLLDGRYISIQRVPMASGGHTSVYSDVTERYNRETELEAARNTAEEANQAKSRFIANISHELRTPLNAILGYSEFLLMNEKENDPAIVKSDEYLEAIHSAGGTLLDAINQILDLSKIEAGKIILTMEDVDLHHMVEDAATLVHAQTLMKQIHLTFVHPEIGTVVHADRIALMQIVSNLLSNAVKFTPEKGEITVTEGIQDGWAFISVADTGIGIDPKLTSQIMEPFAQVVDAQYHPQEGTGLGLSIVKSLTEMHQGRVEVSSEPGKGATFTVLLPPERTRASISAAD